MDVGMSSIQAYKAEGTPTHLISFETFYWLVDSWLNFQFTV